MRERHFKISGQQEMEIKRMDELTIEVEVEVSLPSNCVHSFFSLLLPILTHKVAVNHEYRDQVRVRGREEEIARNCSFTEHE